MSDLRLRPEPRPEPCPPPGPAAPAGPTGPAARTLAVAAALALLAFGANMAGPLYPGYQSRLGFDDLTLTLVYATYSVASVPALLLLGPLGDRLGRMRLVRAGLVAGVLGSVCFAVGDHVAWLLAGRVLQGVALGAATGVGMVVLAGASTTGARRRIAAAGALAFLAGTAAGPGLTGLLAELVPAPHVVAHVLHAVALLGVLWWLRPSRARRRSGRRGARGPGRSRAGAVPTPRHS
ncbi:MFS transporter [Pseudonocardia sp. EC080625-04]|uniref:MFS transporter n=1 Tax=Pseudonocardia sp. EC080625-04 TaxID=1096868 RepID=UPI000760F960|nr:MFS transporter [Pseudonocardia sp. EC080625-04]